MTDEINKNVAGCDIGTMFFHTAHFNNEENVVYNIIRNAFVELPASDDVEEMLSQNAWRYIKDGSKYYVIGEDSLRVANMFPDKVELRRPMADGVLNKDEDKKMMVLAELIESTIGRAPDDKSVLCTCVSSESIDQSVDSAFHKARITGMFKRLGWNVKIIEEAMAVVLSEKPTAIETDSMGEKHTVPYTGIAISMGGGRSNAVIAYKGLQVAGMSIAYGGDKIDKKVADATGVPLAQVTRIKEKELDFTNLNYDSDVVFALSAYYEDLIKTVFTKFATKFHEVKSQFEFPLEIVMAGGTSTPKGFCKKVEEVLGSLDLPFKISGVRHASDPRNAIVKGCLIQAAITKKRLDRGDSID